MNALLPPNRKLISIQLRGADFKKLEKNESLDKKVKSKILAYWWFENELKEQYFSFLRNIQIISQSGKDNVKCCTIVVISKLLAYSPEKEQMLLSMLINKLGDPVGQVAGKAMYHLLEVAYKHPNMCGVITKESEKLLFRNNISEKAQHFTLSFLSQISSRADSEVCTKLVDICFKFFKILIEKGDINNKMMQAILRCLRQAITDAKMNEDGTVIPKDTLDTIYRIVHIADINIALQAISLLLQIMTIKTGKYDRFYNALYMKLLDPNLPHIGHNIASMFFYIVHRAIHIDTNVPRCKAILKRLLQICLYFPPPKICATLIVVDKIMKARPELRDLNAKKAAPLETEKQKIAKFENKSQYIDNDDDEEEKYEDADGEHDDKKPSDRELSNASWVHSKLNEKKKGKKTFVSMNNEKTPVTFYDLLARNPMYAGAEYTLNYELIKLLEHFHPTVQIFATKILSNKPITYKGDPLRDFALPQFLDRFSFRNPKSNSKSSEGKTFIHRVFRSDKGYTPQNSRNLPVRALSLRNCTEDQLFIFQYLEKKREIAASIKKKDDDEESLGSVDDDEFDSYLDSLGAAKDFEEDDDYLDEITENMSKEKSKKKGKKDNNDDDDEVDHFASDDNESDNDENDQNVKKSKLKNGSKKLDDDIDDFDDSDDDGSISLDDDDDEEVMSFSDEDDDAETKKKKPLKKSSKQNIKDDESDSDDEGLLSIDEDFEESDNENSFDESNDDDDDGEPTSKKSKLKTVTAKDFQRKMKHSTDMSSLFASADEFAELLEETGKSKKHGTLSDVFNNDKSSDKQLDWEGKRQNMHKRNNWSNKKNNNRNMPQRASKKRKR